MTTAHESGTPGAAVHLKIKNVSVMFGQVRAVRGVTLEARPGEVVAIFGTNGWRAGCTTSPTAPVSPSG